ncbi:MAG: DUF177 domain-containing protein [Endozoicomonadaceae bacterium]|nr:DUF177 domain-containing protein [Endozoicomonadaceae bacterium]
MLNRRLPKQITPLKFAQNEYKLVGRIAVGELDRLVEMLAGKEAEVALSLEFFLEDNRRPMITGELKAELPMICQRCLDVVCVSIQTEINLAVVWSEEQAKALPKDLDPLIMKDDTADLQQLVEDELLLSLPLVAYHENDRCHAGRVFSTDPNFDEVLPECGQKKLNPFSVLAQLKTDDQSIKES